MIQEGARGGSGSAEATRVTSAHERKRRGTERGTASGARSPTSHAPSHHTSTRTVWQILFDDESIGGISLLAEGDGGGVEVGDEDAHVTDDIDGIHQREDEDERRVEELKSWGAEGGMRQL